MQTPMLALPAAAEAAEVAVEAAEDAVEAAELESPPPQAVRAAVVPTTADAFRKSRREIIFIIAFSFIKKQNRVRAGPPHAKGRVLSVSYYTLAVKLCAIVKTNKLEEKVLGDFDNKKQIGLWILRHVAQNCISTHHMYKKCGLCIPDGPPEPA